MNRLITLLLLFPTLCFSQITLQGTVRGVSDIDDDTIQVVATITIYHGTNKDSIGTFSSDQHGQYIVALADTGTYTIHVSADGYLPHAQTISANRPKEYHLDMELRAICLDCDGHIEIHTLFYAHKSIEPLPDSTQNTLELLSKILLDYPELKLEISGCYDQQEAKDTSTDWGHKRAQKVYQTLIAVGVPQKQLTTVSKLLFEKFPKMEARSVRRVEFRILDE